MAFLPRFVMHSLSSLPKSLLCPTHAATLGYNLANQTAAFHGRSREKATASCFGPLPRVHPLLRRWLYRGTKRLQEFSWGEWFRSGLLAWVVARVHLALCVRRFAFQRQGYHLRSAQLRPLVQPRLSRRCCDDMGRRRSLRSTSLTPRRKFARNLTRK